MSDVCVVHLVWARLGLEPLERFAASYRRHPAGADHRLLLVFKQFRERAPLDAARAVVADLPHESLQMPGRKLDLAAYPRMARERSERHLFFCNSSTELLDSGWLVKMLDHLRGDGVGLVSATGSYESLYSPSSPVSRVLRKRHFDPFPNPHLRTNAFAIERELMLSLDWPEVRSKSRAWRLESGRRSVTRQVWERGLEALVVGRDGKAYERERWPESRTFRASEQENLLAADNRTRQYAEADPVTREALARLAWGEPAVAPTPTPEAAARPGRPPNARA